jgi:hypothetical protein
MNIPDTNFPIQLDYAEVKNSAVSAVVARTVSKVKEPLLMMLAQTDFTLVERRIYWWILCEYNKNPPKVGEMPNLYFKIAVKDLEVAVQQVEREYMEQVKRNIPDTGVETGEVVQTRSEYNYSYYRKICDKIADRKISIDHIDELSSKHRTVGRLNIFQGALYKNGSIYVVVSQLVAPVMANLSQGYSKYQLKAALLMRTDSSQLLYVRCCRFLDTGWWEVSVEELKIMFSATNYNRYSNFKQRVLIPASEEINNRSDIFITVDELKKGRQIDRIRFTIKTVEEAQKDYEKQEVNDIIAQIQQMPFEYKVEKARTLLNTSYNKLGSKIKFAILIDEATLNKFIEIDQKIATGLLTVKDKCAYLATAIMTKKVKTKSTQEKTVMLGLDFINKTNY